MVTAIVLVAVLVGLVALATMTLAQRRQLAAAPPPPPPVWPPVSILKPMRGVDAGLEENLASFFRLDYPAYEILLGVDDATDTALAVARRVAQRHPQVEARIVVDASRVGVNPKVNNLANLLRHARCDVLLISDSNVRVEGEYLRELVAHLEQPGVGLVSSPIRGIAGGGAGAKLEALQLDTFVMGGVCAMHRLFGAVCVVGKSMLMRRETLGAIGGFAHLGRFLAEDQVCGQDVVALGRRVALAHRPIDNVLGDGGIASFVSRHLRWARIRSRMSPAGYLGELLLNPVFAAALGLALAPGRVALAVLVGALLAKASLDAAASRAAGVPESMFAILPRVLLKDLIVGAVWIVPWFSRRVTWRGRDYRIGRRTALGPAPGRSALPSQPSGSAAPGWTGPTLEVSSQA